MALRIWKVMVTSCFLWSLWREQVEMGGLLVKDKNFWSIKYPKQSKLPSKHLGSLSLNFKIEAIKDLWTPSTWMDLAIFAKFNATFCGYMYTHVFFFFLGRGSTTIIRLGSCLKMLKNHCFWKTNYILFCLDRLKNTLVWKKESWLDVLSNLPSILQAAYETWMAALKIKH